MSTALIIAGCVLGYVAIGLVSSVVVLRLYNENPREWPTPLMMLFWPVFTPIVGLYEGAARLNAALDARAERKRLPEARTL